MRGPGRDNKVVIFERAVGDHDAVLGEIDVLHLGEKDFDVVIASEDLPDWNGDLGGRDECGGHLIKKRLERVMVLPVNESDANGSVAEMAGGVESAKAATDDDYMRNV